MHVTHSTVQYLHSTMRQEEADRQIAVMQAILKDYEQKKQEREPSLFKK